MKIHLPAALLAMAASIGILSPTIASAAEGQERSASISYADIDLGTEAGLAELDRRIERAARWVCHFDEHQVGTRIRSREARECVAETRQNLDTRFAAIIREARYGG